MFPAVKWNSTFQGIYSRNAQTSPIWNSSARKSSRSLITHISTNLFSQTLAPYHFYPLLSLAAASLPAPLYVSYLSVPLSLATSVLPVPLHPLSLNPSSPFSRRFLPPLSLNPSFPLSRRFLPPLSLNPSSHFSHRFLPPLSLNPSSPLSRRFLLPFPHWMVHWMARRTVASTLVVCVDQVILTTKAYPIS